jgi:rhodanese-related sulfurtransferase
MRLWRGVIRLLLGLALAVAMTTTVLSADAQDLEEATHGDEAATYQVVETYEFPGFKVIQFDLAVLSHFSYLVASGGECLVVDPGRDIESYVRAAEEHKVKITGVWLTHSHADFVAGHVEFAKRLNVPIRISEKSGAAYQHIALKENDTLQFGEVILKFLDTPGHTPDSMCAVASSKANPDQPLALFTGDTLFVGSVGRPDLMGEGMSASTLASMMYDTWNNKLSKLPDDVIILPAHGSGSLCGAHLSDEPASTIGAQRTTNTYLQHKSRGEFIAAILEGLPEAPQYFAHNAAMNQRGPELVEWQPASLPTVEPSPELADPSKHYVIDVRDAQLYADGHIPNSVNIALRGRLETWTGIMVPWGANAVVTGSGEDIREAIFRLHRVGYEVRGLVFDAWKQAQLPIVQSKTITPQQLYAQMQEAESPVVVDVRRPSEWAAERIGTVVNIPLNELKDKAGKVDKRQTVVTVCNSAYRSSLALGVMERLGFDEVKNMVGGGEAWVEAGLPVVSSVAAGGASTTARRSIRLAERISAPELKRIMMDLPNTIQIVDIRPPAHFADYRLPGSQNVDIAELLENPVYQTGAGALVIVCRDGSLSMMAAGILSQKTERNIKALYGGVESYWLETGVAAISSPGSSSALRSVPRAMSPPATPPAGTAKPITTNKRKRAGC